MRQSAKVLAAAMIAVSCWPSGSEAGLLGMPRVLAANLARMSFSVPALAPIGHTRFCNQYPADCEVRGAVDFRRRNIELTPERWAELSAVNLAVNRDIVPQRNAGGLATEEWLLSPKAGDCNDYAVTKRHELLTRGWPSRSLLLSEVVTGSGEHHLVLVVRLKEIDLVLDNLNANVRPIALTRYQWVRVESPSNPKFWSTVSVPGSIRASMLTG